MTQTDPALAAAAEVAAALLGTPVDAIAPVRGAGRNSRVYRVSRAGQSFALKHYPSPEKGGQGRLRIEAGALDLMAGHDINCVPRILAADAERGYALIEWIEGHAVSEVSPTDIDAASEFLAAVHQLRGVDAAQGQPLAAEACLSGAEIAAQIERRTVRLSAVCRRRGARKLSRDLGSPACGDDYRLGRGRVPRARDGFRGGDTGAVAHLVPIRFRLP